MKRVVVAKGSFKKGVWTVTTSADGRKATARGPTFKSAYNAAVNALTMMQMLSSRGTA